MLRFRLTCCFTALGIVFFEHLKALGTTVSTFRVCGLDILGWRIPIAELEHCCKLYLSFLVGASLVGLGIVVVGISWS